MEKSFFERCLKIADLYKAISNQSNFYIGYIRGIRRAYHGSAFGTEEEHEKYLNISESDPDINRQLLGIGYRIGYAGIDISMFLKLQICTRCGYEFIPTRVKRDNTGGIIEILLPKTCPNPTCNSPYWNKPRQTRPSK